MGKYNDGTPEARQALADRLYDAMARSTKSIRREPVSPDRVEGRPSAFAASQGGRVLRRAGPANDRRRARQSARARIKAAMILAWIERVKAGRPVADRAACRMGSLRILGLPGRHVRRIPALGPAGVPGQVRGRGRLRRFRHVLSVHRPGLRRPRRLRADVHLRRSVRVAGESRDGRGAGGEAGWPIVSGSGRRLTNSAQGESAPACGVFGKYCQSR